MSITEPSRTWLCSVVFIDIVGYSKRPIKGQLEVKQHLTQLIRHGLKGARREDVVILDSGDGAAVCFLADPVEALYFGINLHSSMLSKGDEAPDYACRIGINLGPVKVIRDVNGRRNTVGDGINSAQRVMDFAEPNQLLVSRSFHDVVACLSEEYFNLFSYLGTRHDKHVKEYDIYEIVPSSEGLIFERASDEAHEEVLDDPGKSAAPVAKPAANAPAPVPTPEPASATASAPASSPAPAAAGYEWQPQELERITRELAEHIGPLAKVLVKRAAKRACSPDELHKLLAQHLPDGSLRTVFLQHAASGKAAAAPPAAAQVAVPDAGLPTGVPIPDDIREKLRHQLAESQGPLAKVLIKRAAAKAADYPQFYKMLAKELPESERTAFIAYAKKLLPAPR